MPDRELPFISIMVAARNEADNIQRCLNSLLNLDYPSDKIEILIGDDASEDGTPWLVELEARKHKRIRLKQIDHQVGQTKGKANVLAQLVPLSQGSLLLFTDADVEVNPSWARSMAMAATDADFVTGFTAVREDGFFASLQAADWILAQGMVKYLSDRGTAVTAMGNNMLVRREAYLATGGYAKILFSITEDLALFRAVLSQDGRFTTEMSPDVKAWTLACSGIGGLLAQRRRWMHGAMQVALLFRIPLILQCLSFLFYLAIMFISPMMFIVMFVAKALVQALLIAHWGRKVRESTKVGVLLAYEFYLCLISFLTLSYFLLPIPHRWKGRSY